MSNENIVYLSLRMDPAVCIRCKEPFITPATWEQVDFDAWIIQCDCGNCGGVYNVIMSHEQAEIWDEELTAQKIDMSIAADQLRIADEMVSVGA